MSALTSQPAYRAFLVNPDGRIHAAHVLNCETDEQAIAAAQKYVDGCGVQLWDQGRKIAEFPPGKAPQQSCIKPFQ
jgi:hypothetical protein